MTTVGVYGFIINGVEKITYNGVDSYPTWIGSQMMKAIQEHGIEPFKEAVSMLEIVDGDGMPNEQQIKEYFHYSGKEEGMTIIDWNDLLSLIQGNITLYLNHVRQMVDAKALLADAVTCRWAYIINFDTGKFEIYFGGNNMNPAAAGRYAKLQIDYNKELGAGFDKVRGVVLIREIPFTDIMSKVHPMNIVQYMSELYDEVKDNATAVGNSKEIMGLYHKAKGGK